MRKIKVLRIITRLNVGGPAQHASFLSSALNGLEFETTLVTGEIAHNEGDMSFLTEGQNIRSIRLRDLSNEIRPAADLKSIWRIYRIIKAEKPDIVHLHLFKSRLLGGLAAKIAGTAHVIETFHGNLLNEYFGRLTTRVILAVERFLGWIVVDHVIAISESQKAELLHHRICPERKIRVVPLGIDLNRFLECGKFKGHLRQELGISENMILIGAIGRLVPIKGLSFLLQAISIVSSSTRVDFCCLVVGDGAERDALEKQVQDLALRDKVRFLGWRFDLERIYADLDIVVLSSLNEGTPLSLIEAMAAGRAVIATRVGAVPDVVRDRENGFLVASKDPIEMATALGELLDNTALRLSLGQHAKTSVFPKYDVSRLIDDMKQLYSQLASTAVPLHSRQPSSINSITKGTI